jgi:ADP-ribosyl-[dinitrogen reductase] hydrolase
MIGAIIGDLIGSVYEYRELKTKDFPLFTAYSDITDDSILTFAVYEALEKCNGVYDDLGKKTIREFVRYYARYPNPTGGYGGSFLAWVDKIYRTQKIAPPYYSYGNGSAMRISPVAYFARSLEHCLDLARKVTEVTHNHPEGLKGAEATAAAVYLALQGKSKEAIKEYIQKHYYSLNKTCDEIRQTYGFAIECERTVPERIQAFWESSDFEDAIRLTVSLGGDADTMGAITGAIAGAYYGVPSSFVDKLFEYLDDFCTDVAKRMLKRIEEVKPF